MKRFAVFFDVDGVLKNGERAIKGASNSLINLRNNNVSFRILTNGGGDLEENRANKLNKILGFDNGSKYRIRGDEIVMCHTPIKKYVNTHKDRMIIAAGIGDIPSILTSYGFKKFMTTDEYCQIYNHSLSHFLREESHEQIMKTKDIVEKRLNVEFKLNHNKVFTPFLKFDSIFVMTDVSRWEKSIQVLMDILISKDGTPGHLDFQDTQPVDMLVSAYDTWYKDDFPLNRLAGGGFVKSLELMFMETYQKSIDFEIIGKPSNKIFDYGKELVRQSHECDRFYMVGDNPEVDIKGANNSNVESILVRTGVWHKHHNCLKNPAKNFVEDVNEAVNLILKKEKC